MSRIDSQMLQIHQRCTQNQSDKGRKISEKEAILLIDRAAELNESSSSSFSSESHRGNKYLLRLLDKETSSFSSEARDMIRKFVVSGQKPAGMGQGHGGRVDGGHGHHHDGPVGGGGHHDGGHGPIGGGGHHGGGHGPIGGGGNIPHHPSDRPTHGGGVNPGRPSGGIAGPSGPSGGVAGPGVNPGTPSNGGVTGPSAGSGVEGPHGKEILNFKAAKATWECHWFPQQETRPGGDPVNNLYAVNGPLHKLDLLTGGSARDYEYANSRKAVDAGKQYSWWGHCNNASEAACLLQAPRHSVIMKAHDGTSVTFTPGDIQGLLVKVTPFLSDKVDFKGARFNEATRDDPNDPRPEMFLQVMQEWSGEGIPFVLDIDNREQVWNFPYDQVKIYESDKAPEGAPSVGGAGTKFYHIEMAGTGYDAKRRVYECFVQRDGSGKVTNSGWIKTPNTHNNPDFMWRPHPRGDLMQKSTWQRVEGRGTNPQVDPQVVYEIYRQSIA